ncbi:MAG TPA: phage major capsid protein [Candidatus Omnitrophica bacterium]|nr:phage major capsid protein [Candidatus Omnitrophota bacterium]
MSFPNVSDIIATTLEARSKEIADNVSNNNALLAWLKKKPGGTKSISGGRLIYQELSFAENANGGFYSGYDNLAVNAQDVITAAEFAWKQYAVPVVMSGLEQLQNGGKEATLDLLEGRIGVAESTMANAIGSSIYSNGTGSGGKEITGLLATCPLTPTTGTYGGIDRSVWSFWQPYFVDTTAAASSTTIQGIMNTAWATLVRGADKPNLIIAGAAPWAAYMASLQALQRFTEASSATLGFPSVKYMGSADVVLDSGVPGDTGTDEMLMLNTKYLHFVSHKDRNMVPLSPQKRYSVNQDAEVQILAWAGNLTCSNSKLQGRLAFNT